MNKKVKGNVSLLIARLFSGFNINGMKYLVPLWIAPLTCVSLRLLFGTLMFWAIGIFEKPDTSSTRDRIKLLLLGAIAVFGYMALYAVALSMTTPVTLAILNAMQPVWVLILSALFLGEKITRGRFFGIATGFVGAVLCVLSQPHASLATNHLFGTVLGFLCSLFYAVYLVSSSGLLQRVDNMTMLRYTFLGALISSFLLSLFTGFDAPLFHAPIDHKALLVFVYILIFPTVISYLLIPIGIKYLPATTVAIYGYVTLFVATITSLLMGTDKLNTMQSVALLLISLSIYWTSINDSK